jgi:hypothetical protein
MGTTAGFWVSFSVTAFGFCLVLAYHLVFFPSLCPCVFTSTSLYASYPSS